MKTTRIDFSKESSQEKDSVKTMNDNATNNLRSLRPQKSMMRVKSLKPKRLILGTKLRTKA